MKEKSNPLLDKSYAFAIRIVKAYQYLCTEHREYNLSKQLLRCGTSIGANSSEAQGGQSKKDFAAKIQIAYKEAKETHFWIRLLRDTNYFEPKLANSLLKDCEELLRIIASILKSSRKNFND